jgi:hypothetical protein
MTSLDAFVDHEGAFLRYLDAQEANTIGQSLGLYLREVHSIHSKVEIWIVALLSLEGLHV